MRRKSSFHWINGDGRLSGMERLLYYVCFGLEKVLNRGGLCEDYEIAPDTSEIKAFLGVDDLSGIGPIRLVCTAFLVELFSDIEFRYMVDIGCGRGNYCQYFRNLGRSFRYLGIDVTRREEWSSLSDEDTRFIMCRLGCEFPTSISDHEDVDFVFSQSAFEHIEFDLEVMRWARTSFPNAVHVHLVPATSSFFCYLTHGYRRYGGASLRRLANAVGEDVRIYPLGSRLTREMHMDFYQSYMGRAHPLARFYAAANHADIFTEAIDPKRLVADRPWNCDFFAIVRCQDSLRRTGGSGASRGALAMR